ncbi:MAG: acetyltransferase [Armatimonadetes bacterium]|nr:acetyltransferase [Armatimonadota bacterium]
MNRRILILGNRTLAEELADMISEVPGCEVAGFVENLDPTLCEKQLCGLPVYWLDDIAQFKDTHLCVCGIATTHRKIYVEQAQALGMSFTTIIHPTARVSCDAVLGAGCFIGPLCNVSYKASLGQQVLVNKGAIIGHHTDIGSFTTVQPGSTVAGMVNIGSGVYIGIGSTIIDRINIGSNSIVAAGSVVVKDVPDAVQVMGVPARIVKTGVEGK